MDGHAEGPGRRVVRHGSSGGSHRQDEDEADLLGLPGDWRAFMRKLLVKTDA